MQPTAGFHGVVTVAAAAASRPEGGVDRGPASCPPQFRGGADSFSPDVDSGAPLERPRGIKIADGRVYVSDTNGQRVQIFTLDGAFLGEWGSAGSGDGQFECPLGIVVAPGNTVYVSDPGRERIQAFCVNPPRA